MCDDACHDVICISSFYSQRACTKIAQIHIRVYVRGNERWDRGRKPRKRGYTIYPAHAIPAKEQPFETKNAHKNMHIHYIYIYIDAHVSCN